MPLLPKTQHGILKVCDPLCCISKIPCLLSQSKAASLPHSLQFRASTQGFPVIYSLYCPVTLHERRQKDTGFLFENIFSNVSGREDALQYNFVFHLAIFVRGKQIPGQICYLGV